MGSRRSPASRRETPLTIYPNAASDLQVRAKTATAGFPLINGTPTILSYTTPNDGQKHSILVASSKSVSVLEVGGVITVSFFINGVQGFSNIFPGGNGVGDTPENNPVAIMVDPNTVVSVFQGSALTAGASILYASIMEVQG